MNAYPSTFNQVFGYIVILDHEPARQQNIRTYLGSRVTNYVIDTITDRDEAIQFLVKGTVVPNLVFASAELLSLLESYPLGGRMTFKKDKDIFTLTHASTGITIKLTSSHIESASDTQQKFILSAIGG
jgi:hypothetical protein